MRVLPDHIKSVYFIGIGGIGMSAVARHFRHAGVQVAGYDRDNSELVQQLIAEGMQVHFEDDAALVGTPDLVVYTPAIPEDHQQLAYARLQDLPLLKRSEVLGMLSRAMRCIAVAGTHGKTTTSALLTFLLRHAGVDVTAFLGGLSVDFNGNFVAGTSEWMVAEADEYDRSFLQLAPEIAVITSLDPDHLDIYGSFEAMCRTYLAFMGQVQPGGMIVIHEDAWERLQEFISDEQRTEMRERMTGGIIYGEKNSSNIVVQSLESDGHSMQFDLKAHDSEYRGLRLNMPGAHNVMNATATIACALAMQEIFEVPEMNWLDGAKALSQFNGIKRRFEIIHASDGLTVIDDYAHHPQELAAAIAATRRHFPGQNITGVFQPHLYSRTADFHREFATALSELDICILVELYPAREQPIPGVRSEMIVEHVRAREKYCVGKPALKELLIRTDPEILLFMGAGDLDRQIPEIVEALTQT